MKYLLWLGIFCNIISLGISLYKQNLDEAIAWGISCLYAITALNYEYKQLKHNDNS